MADDEDMSIENLVLSLESYKLLKNENDVLNELLSYNELYSTAEIARHYSTLMIL